MIELAYALALVLVALLAWDGWRRYLAHQAAKHGDSLEALRKDLDAFADVMSRAASRHNADLDARCDWHAAVLDQKADKMGADLEKWTQRTGEFMEEVNILKRSSAAGIARGRGRVPV